MSEMVYICNAPWFIATFKRRLLDAVIGKTMFFFSLKTPNEYVTQELSFEPYWQKLSNSDQHRKKLKWEFLSIFYV